MSIHFRCARCQAAYHAENDAADSFYTCLQCGQHLLDFS